MSLMTVEARTVPMAIHGPIARSDLPGLYARACAILESNAGSLITCDVSGCAADAVAVEALARFQLGARRHGAQVRIVNASDELDELIALFGLKDVLPA
jgi:ABC-type transporter Mla MlaB component